MAEMRRKWIVAVFALVALLGCGHELMAQQAAPGGPLMGLGLGGKWWDRPMLVQRLGLTPQQREKMNGILQQHRLHLVDLRANLQKAEIELEPLVNADEPNDAAIMDQVGKVADARAELEKANARLLLAVRHELTLTQWQQMRQMIAERRAQLQEQRMNGMNGPMNRMGRMGMGSGMSGVGDGSPDGANLPPAPRSGNPPQQ